MRWVSLPLGLFIRLRWFIVMYTLSGQTGDWKSFVWCDYLTRLRSLQSYIKYLRRSNKKHSRVSDGRRGSFFREIRTIVSRFSEQHGSVKIIDMLLFNQSCIRVQLL